MRIGLILLSNSQTPIPSTRIAILNIIPMLQSSGFSVEVIFDPSKGSEQPDLSHLCAREISRKVDVVIFQKVYGQTAVRLAQELTNIGVASIFLVCDRINPAMAEATTRTVVVTAYLRNAYPEHLRAKISVIHDGIERPELKKICSSQNRGSLLRPLVAVLVTSEYLTYLPVLRSPPMWLRVMIVGRYPPWRQPRKRLKAYWSSFWLLDDWTKRFAYLKFLANPRINLVAWDERQVYRSMLRADIGIVPIEPNIIDEDKRDGGASMLKSENRLTLKMCAGLPVVSTPIPSYKEVVTEGEDGFLAESRYDWIQALSKLRSPELREQIGQAARKKVIQKYSKASQAEKMIALLREIGNANG